MAGAAPSSFQCLMQFALWFANTGQWKKALAYAECARSLRPEDLACLVLLVHLLERTGRDQNIAELLGAIDRSEDPRRGTLAWPISILKARQLARAGDRAAARTALREGLPQEPLRLEAGR